MEIKWDHMFPSKLWQLLEISYSKWVELMDAEAKKNLKDEVLQIITEQCFELGKASLRKKIMNL